MNIDGLGELKVFGLMHFDFEGSELMVSRTGFTGDLGYELWIEPGKAEALWDALFEAGKLYGIRADWRACARDGARRGRLPGRLSKIFCPRKATVRTGRTRSPLELGLDWLVDFKKPNFNGRRALAEEKRSGSTLAARQARYRGQQAAQHSYIFR